MLGCVLAHLVVVGRREEAADAQEVEHLLVHLLLRVDERINHLFGVAVHRRQVHREVYLWGLRGSRDVHQAVYSDVVAGERATYLQVAQRHSVHRIFRLQVEWGVVWVASEGNGSALQEVEVFLDEVLDGELVHTMVYHIVAKHVERALVEVVGLYHSVAVERDVVARLLVHDELHSEVLVGGDEEVDAHVRREVDVVFHRLDGHLLTDAVG